MVHREGISHFPHQDQHHNSCILPYFSYSCVLWIFTGSPAEVSFLTNPLSTSLLPVTDPNVIIVFIPSVINPAVIFMSLCGGGGVTDMESISSEAGPVGVTLPILVIVDVNWLGPNLL